AARAAHVRRPDAGIRGSACRGSLLVRRVVLLLRKDLRVLLRSPLLLGVLIAYPLLVAGLVGLVAGYGSSKPRVALVGEDHLPRIAHVGGQSFGIQDAIDEVGKNVHLVRGGRATCAGKTYNGRGLARMGELLQQLPRGPQRDRIAEFARIAGVALTQTGSLLAATASPIGLERAREASRSSLLSAQVQA